MRGFYGIGIYHAKFGICFLKCSIRNIIMEE